MTHKKTREAAVQLAGMLAIAAAGTAAYWVGEGASGGLQAGAVLFAFALVVYFGRRCSATIETISGVGDERTRALTQRAAAFSGYAMRRQVRFRSGGLPLKCYRALLEECASGSRHRRSTSPARLEALIQNCSLGQRR